MAVIVRRCLLLPLLKQRKMTQQDLADRVGLTKQQVNNYARNRTVMSFEIAVNIAMILGCSPEELYEFEVVSLDVLKARRSRRQGRQ